MKPKCYLARSVMAGMCPQCPLPAWVSRHIERCDQCRTEADAYPALRSLLGAQGGEEACPVEWADVRALLRNPEPIRRPVWRTALGAACLTAVIVGIAIWVWIGGASNKEPTIRQPRYAQAGDSAPKKPRVVLKPAPAPSLKKLEPAKPVSKAAQPKRPKSLPARYHRRALPPHRLMVKHETPPEPRKTAPGAPRIVAIAPEEHVIGIVGVNVGRDEEYAYVELW